MSIEVVKAFVQLRHVLTSQKEMAEQIAEIRSFMLKQSNKADREFIKVWRAMEALENSTKDVQKGPIGFRIS